MCCTAATVLTKRSAGPCTARKCWRGLVAVRTDCRVGEVLQCLNNAFLVFIFGVLMSGAPWVASTTRRHACARLNQCVAPARGGDINSVLVCLGTGQRIRANWRRACAPGGLQWVHLQQWAYECTLCY